MSKLIAVLVLFVTASGTSALADGYSDFNAGITASEFADPQIVIGHLSQAIASQDLPQHLLPTALKARGYDYLTTKNYDGAIADFAAALHLRPNAPDLYLGLCSAYESKHMTAEALSNCAQAAALQPDNLRVNEFLDEIYIQMGREDDAIANYSKFIAARPQNLALVLARANLYVQTGRYDYALPDALAAVNLDPDNATLYGFLSRVYLVKGDLQKAQENIETDIGKDGTDPLAYLAKGQVLWAMGKYDDAADAFSDSLHKKNDQQFAFIWLSMTKAKLKDTVRPGISARFASGDLKQWPGSLVALFLGKGQPDDLLKMSGKDPYGENYSCVNGFFVGEWYLAQSNATKAHDLLAQAAKSCDGAPFMKTMTAIELARTP